MSKAPLALVGDRPTDAAAARVAVRARRLGDAERLQRLGGDDPRRHGRAEALAEERPERLRFPLLDVARRPVVDEAEPERCARRRRAIGIGSPWRVAGTDPHRELQLVIELAARADRSAPPRRAVCAGRCGRRTGTPDWPHRRGAAVIGDRHVFVVRAQRIVRVAPAPAIGGVVDAGEEIGEIADRRRQVQRAVAGACSSRSASGSALAASRAVGGEQLEDPPAQRAARRGASAISGLRRRAADAASAATAASPENSPASSAAAGRRSCRRSRCRRAARASGTVAPGGLNTPSGRFCSGNSRAVGRGDPTFARRVMGFVDHASSRIRPAAAVASDRHRHSGASGNPGATAVVASGDTANRLTARPRNAAAEASAGSC